MPDWHFGTPEQNIPGGIEFLLLVVSQLLDLQGAVARIALAGIFVLLGVSIELVIIAQRRTYWRCGRERPD